MPYKSLSRWAAFFQLEYSLAVAEEKAIANAPAAINNEPPATWAYTFDVKPRSSLKTIVAQIKPQSWFVFDKGIPRLMPTYLAA